MMMCGTSKRASDGYKRGEKEKEKKSNFFLL
jgi:hypothetical protein